MIKANQISSDLVANSALLASGSCWLIAGGGIAAFGLMAAPLAGLGGLSVSAFYKRLKSKSPNSRKAIARIQDAIYRKLAKEAFFDQIDLDRDDFEAADKVLADHIVAHWPAPQVIVNLSVETAGFPKSVAEHVLSSMNESIFTMGLFEKETPRKFAMLTIEASLEAALTEESYFKEIQPHAIMKLLDHAGEISRGVRRLEGLPHEVQVVGDTLSRVESKLNGQSEKLDEILNILKGTNDSTHQSSYQVRASIEQMLQSKMDATQTVLQSLTEENEGLDSALKVLQNTIDEQQKVAQKSKENVVNLTIQYGVLNYYKSPQMALKAFSNVIDLDPGNIDALNLAGSMHMVLGNLREARKHFLFALKFAEKADNRKQIMIAQLSLGRFYEGLDNYVKTFVYRRRIWKRALEWKADYPIAIVGYEYGETCIRIGFLEQAKGAIGFAFGAAQELSDEKLITQGYCLLAMLERREKNYEHALKLSNSAIRRYKDIHGDDDGYHRELVTAGTLLRDLNRNHDSEAILLEAKKWLVNHGDHSVLAALYAQLGETTLALGQQAKAVEHLQKSYQLFLEAGSTLKAKYVHERLQAVSS